jgi:hypothetical protein
VRRQRKQPLEAAQKAYAAAMEASAMAAPPVIHCDLCEVSFTAEAAYQQHIAGPVHRKKVEARDRAAAGQRSAQQNEAAAAALQAAAWQDAGNHNRLMGGGQGRPPRQQAGGREGGGQQAQGQGGQQGQGGGRGRGRGGFRPPEPVVQRPQGISHEQMLRQLQADNDPLSIDGERCATGLLLPPGCLAWERTEGAAGQRSCGLGASTIPRGASSGRRVPAHRWGRGMCVGVCGCVCVCVQIAVHRTQAPPCLLWPAGWVPPAIPAAPAAAAAAAPADPVGSAEDDDSSSGVSSDRSDGAPQGALPAAMRPGVPPAAGEHGGEEQEGGEAGGGGGGLAGLVGYGGSSDGSDAEPSSSSSDSEGGGGGVVSYF